eukprot:TRINITY_DN8104_c0_g1_i1.p1 TRINITY_DN8104_c0_g1~~TRINITY_DN8104_c0_g1_i1.p1  ORF type:complete len:528 (-),score=211.71 TRINITY_DN8104_c0_g1_i1:65-1648(-)
MSQLIGLSSSPSPSPLAGSTEGMNHLNLISDSSITVVNEGENDKGRDIIVMGDSPSLPRKRQFSDPFVESALQSNSSPFSLSSSSPSLLPSSLSSPSSIMLAPSSPSTIVVEGRENFAGFPPPIGTLNQQTQKMQHQIQTLYGNPNASLSNSTDSNSSIIVTSSPSLMPILTSSISVVNDSPAHNLNFSVSSSPSQPQKKQRTMKNAPLGSPPLGRMGSPPLLGRTHSSPSMLSSSSTLSSNSPTFGNQAEKSLIHIEEPHSISIEPVASVQIANRIVQSKKGGKGENKYLQLIFDCKKLLNSNDKGTFKKDQEATLNSFLFDRTSKTFKFPNNLDIRLDNKKMILSLKLKLPKKGQLIGFTHEDCRIMCHIRIGSVVVARGFSNTFNVVCRKDQIKDEDVIVTRESRHQAKKDKDQLLAKFESSVKSFLMEGPSEMSLTEKRNKMIAILEKAVEDTYAETKGKDSTESHFQPRNFPSSPLTIPSSPGSFNAKGKKRAAKEEQSDREETAKVIAMLAMDKSGKNFGK